jgi:hypothetical protein
LSARLILERINGSVTANQSTQHSPRQSSPRIKHTPLRISRYSEQQLPYNHHHVELQSYGYSQARTSGPSQHQNKGAHPTPRGLTCFAYNRANADTVSFLRPPEQAVSVLAPPVPYSHHHVQLRLRTVCRSAYAQELLPLDSELPGPFNLSSYDHDGRVQTGAVHRLSENKHKLRQAFEVRCFEGLTGLHPYIK